MDSYVKNKLKRKVSSFILSEAGKVGNRNTFSAAALVTASSLAAVLLFAGNATAASYEDCCKPPPYGMGAAFYCGGVCADKWMVGCVSC